MNCELEIIKGQLAGHTFNVPEMGLRLGRSSSNDIHVPDEELSRSHCLFERVGEDGLRVTDLASANGTFLNGNSIGSDPVQLKPGDVIAVGRTVLRVVGGAAPVAVEPPKTVSPLRAALAKGVNVLAILAAVAAFGLVALVVVQVLMRYL